MLGNIQIYKPEMKVKEYELYRAYYCGLCRQLGKNNQICRFAVSYDLSAIAVLLDGLTESDTNLTKKACIVHPFTKNFTIDIEKGNQKDLMEYVAQALIILVNLKLDDDWKDEKKAASLAAKGFFRTKDNTLKRELEELIKKLTVIEKNNDKELWKAANISGEITAAVAGGYNDVQQDLVRGLAKKLGSYLYFCDAYEDMQKDKKKNNYNIFLLNEDKNSEELFIKLTDECVNEACKIYDLLDFKKIDNKMIIGNIVYDGLYAHRDNLIKEK